MYCVLILVCELPVYVLVVDTLPVTVEQMDELLASTVGSVPDQEYPESQLRYGVGYAIVVDRSPNVVTVACVPSALVGGNV